jgi:hypothetical protein
MRSPNKVHLAMHITRRGARHFAVVAVAKADRSSAGAGDDREAAIADALHRNRIFYADLAVERDVVLAEARKNRIELVLVDDTLYLPSSKTQE